MISITGIVLTEGGDSDIYEQIFREKFANIDMRAQNQKVRVTLDISNGKVTGFIKRYSEVSDDLWNRLINAFNELDLLSYTGKILLILIITQ
jgi:hypothetical protein